VFTSAAGAYNFNSVPQGSYLVLQTAPAGYGPLNGGGFVNIDGLSKPLTLNFTDYATLYNGTGGNDNYLMQRNAAANRNQIYVGGVLSYTVPLNPKPLQFNLGAGNDTLTFDYTNGNA